MHPLDYVLTKQPHSIRAVFVSDLHLSADTPKLSAAFLALVDDLIALPNLHALYVVGDFLDGWLGNDALKYSLWLIPIINKLKRLSQTCHIYVMRGNRDFLISQRLCSKFNGILIDEPYYMTANFLGQQVSIRLEHGDLLCGNDVHYQRFRTIIRSPIGLKTLTLLPIKARFAIKNTIQKHAKKNKAHHSLAIMDVTPHAVKIALQQADILLHGHTHAPNTHLLPDTNKKRLVLGDWRLQDNTVSAVIGILDEQDIGLYRYHYR